MFTLEQIDALHARLGQVETLADYVRALAALGVTRYDSLVCDGHSEYLGADGHRVVSPAVHDTLIVSERGDGNHLVDHLSRHERGETSYLEMSRALADDGIERWTVDTNAMTMTFYNRAGDALLVESIE